MQDKDGDRTGVWTGLPSGVSPEARAFAQFMKDMPSFVASWPKTPEAWRAQLALTKAQAASPEFSLFMNIKPAMRTEVELDGVTYFLFTPEGYDDQTDRRIVLHCHGGGYLGGAPELEAPIATPIAVALGCPVLSIRYPLWWEEAPPADVEQAVRVYRHLLTQRGATSIALMGASAGGGLVLRTVLRLHELGERMPAALALMTPWADVVGAGDTNRTLMPYDILHDILYEHKGALVSLAAVKADRSLSPVDARFDRDFPPSVITTGTRDALLSDCARLQMAFSAAGVDCDLRVYEGMWHGFNTFRLPESDAAVRDVAAFLSSRLSRG